MMRIAMLAPLRVAVPPANYGGTERCIWNLTEGLVQAGHAVTLYASGDSQTSARLVKVVPKALGFVAGQEWQAFHVAMLADFYHNHAQDYDVIHAHMDYFPLPFAEACSTPTVTTLHGRLDFDEFKAVYSAFPQANFVAISASHRQSLPDVNWAGVVHHAVDVPSFPFYPKPGDYLAFVGRISPEKRPDRAIEVAIRTGIPLKIAAKVDPADQEYYETKIKPLMNHPLIEEIGMQDEQGKREVMGNALAVIMPIDWPEPFGIVFIEALACGTPVLTCPCGAAPELIRDGVTGFIRDSVDGLVEAVGHLSEINRADCRADAEQRFDNSRMAREYAAIYAKLIRQENTLNVSPMVANDVASAIAAANQRDPEPPNHVEVTSEDQATIMPIAFDAELDEGAPLS